MVTATIPMNACRKRRLSFTVPLAKGPKPAAVRQIATVATVKVAVTVPCCQKRSAAQIRKGKSTYGCEKIARSDVDTAPKASRLTITGEASNAPASAIRQGDGTIRGRSAQTKNSGARIRSPMASPSHQVNQALPTVAEGMRPPNQPLVTPIVALTIVLRPATPTTNQTTP